MNTCDHSGNGNGKGETEQIVELSNGKYRVIGLFKKPFMRSGAGLLGMMVSTLDGEKLLCHECGQLFARLGCHFKTHRMTRREYLNKHSLFLGQILTSPREHQRVSDRTMAKIRAGILGPSERARDRFKAAGPSAVKSQFHHDQSARAQRCYQNRNRYGTCEEQLKHRLLILAKQCGLAPQYVPYNEDKNLAAAITVHFGSWNEGKARLLGMPINAMNKIGSGETVQKLRRRATRRHVEFIQPTF